MTDTTVHMDREQESLSGAIQQDDRTSSDDDLLATLDEEQEAIVELQKIREMTVEPGLLRLPVSQVTTSPNSEGYVIDLSHPVIPEKELRQHYPKPVSWQRDNDLVRLLDWYTDAGTDPYALQTSRVYVRYDEANDDWTIVRPPDHTRPMREIARDRWLDFKQARPRKSNATMFAFMLAGVIAGSVLPAVIGGPLSMLLPVVVFLIATVLGMVVLEP